MFVISIIGGPGSGKSTVAADVFVRLKKMHYNIELVTEYAKDMTWQESLEVLKNQIYVFAKQHHRLNRLKKKVDIVITDSPILLSCIYMIGENQPLVDLILHEYNKFDNILFYLERGTPFKEVGRVHSQNESKKIDQQILDLINSNHLPYIHIENIDNASNDIVDAISGRISQ